MTHYQPILAQAVRKFPAHEWVEVAAAAGMTIQDVRSPEEALSDPLFLRTDAWRKSQIRSWG